MTGQTWAFDVLTCTRNRVNISQTYTRLWNFDKNIPLGLCVPLLTDSALAHAWREWALPVFMIFGVLKYVEVYRTENSKFPQDEEGGRRREEEEHPLANVASSQFPLKGSDAIRFWIWTVDNRWTRGWMRPLDTCPLLSPTEGRQLVFMLSPPTGWRDLRPQGTWTHSAWTQQGLFRAHFLSGSRRPESSPREGKKALWLPLSKRLPQLLHCRWDCKEKVLP